MTDQSLSLENVSIVLPSRNNLKYLKWSYNSIRKNVGFDVTICMADDASSDGTWDWLQEISLLDSNVKILHNSGPKRVGHTILYDRIVNELVDTKYFIIAHADMYWLPGSIDAMLKYIHDDVIVSATRIEPPLHPDGPEKIIANFGIEPEEFDEDKFLEWFFNPEFGVYVEEEKLMKNGVPEGQVYTEGVFAPWMMSTHRFKELHGHDPLFAPQSKEDSDFWNRALLDDVDFIQTWEGFVYHMTSRGSRFNPTLTTPGKNSAEWEAQNLRSTKNFIRKWGHFVKHDPLMKPIVIPKYDIGLVFKDCPEEMINALEPYFNTMYVDNTTAVQNYIALEQPNTMYNLSTRVISVTPDSMEQLYNSDTHDIMIYVDRANLREEYVGVLQFIHEVIQDSGSVGKMAYGHIQININKMIDYSRNNLLLENNIEGQR